MKIYSRRSLFLTIMCVVFLFRVAIGLSSEFRSNKEIHGDERQEYLIGLKFYTTGAWPYFGSDVSPTRYRTERQIPGALHGLMVGLPLYVWPIVEAPYLWINILSFSSLIFLAWYCKKLLPDIPAWFIWGWLMTAPWTLNYSTRVGTIQYLLPGSIVFFIGALESYQSTRKRLIHSGWASFMMGIGLVWVMQFHLSWVLLVPFALVSFYSQFREYGKRTLTSVVYFLFGLATIGWLVVPTYLKYGFRGAQGNTLSMIGLDASHILQPFQILVRILALPSYVMFDGGILANNTAEAWAFFHAQPWMIPLAGFLSIIGIMQILTLIGLWFVKKPMPPGWFTIKYVMVATVCWVYLSFWFTSREPHIWTFYIILPIAMIYGFYCWNLLLKKKVWQTLAKVVLTCGIIFQTGLAVHNYAHRSLYLNRKAPQSAIDGQDYRLLDERRQGALY